MASKNSPFYSMKFNSPKTLKSHRSESTAVKTARDFGMIFNTELGKQYQIHKMADGSLKKFPEGKPGFEPMDSTMRSILEEAQLITGS